MRRTHFSGILKCKLFSNVGQKTRPRDSQHKKKKEKKKKKKERTCGIVDFAVPADHRVKLKDDEKRDKYQDLARELKKLWNMKVTVIPIVIGALGTVTIGLAQAVEDMEISGRVETIQTTATLRSARILGDLLSLRLQRKTISHSRCEEQV